MVESICLNKCFDCSRVSVVSPNPYRWFVLAVSLSSIPLYCSLFLEPPPFAEFHSRVTGV